MLQLEAELAVLEQKLLPELVQKRPALVQEQLLLQLEAELAVLEQKLLPELVQKRLALQKIAVRDLPAAVQ